MEDMFSGMEGCSLGALKAMAARGRWMGKLRLCRYDDRWALLYLPSGQRLDKTIYLVAEKSRRPRLMSAQAALKVASEFGITGLWVSFTQPGYLRRFGLANRESSPSATGL